MVLPEKPQPEHYFLMILSDEDVDVKGSYGRVSIAEER